MKNELTEPVEKIIQNYLNRLKRHLKGLSENDQEELLKEIHSHIYESYVNDPTESEVERIFHVLDRLGEPAEVASSRMSDAIVTIGKKRKLPFLILSGLLIGLIGVPLGIGGAGILFGLFASVLVLILSFYILAFSLLFTGWIGVIVSIARLINPYFLDPYVQMYPLLPDPVANAIIYILASLLLAALGIGMLLLGRYLMRGFRFLVHVTFEKIRGFRVRRRLTN
ncbi:MAG: DUF1700 domain-containing protein [Candidatus Aminicenantes bacterium]|nr:DUF1700 domain-containing protein [Candidatus Aminicenantes bacterium]